MRVSQVGSEDCSPEPGLSKMGRTSKAAEKIALTPLRKPPSMRDSPIRERDPSYMREGADPNNLATIYDSSAEVTDNPPSGTSAIYPPYVSAILSSVDILQQLILR